MAELGLLGALGAGGKAVADVGKVMMVDELETLRQEKLTKLKEGSAAKTADVAHERAKELKGMDIESRKEVATIAADAKKKVAADKAAADKAGGKPSTAFKEYNELVSGRLSGIEYPEEWAVGIAYGGHKTTTDPRTKEMILLGPDPGSKTGFKEVGRMQPSIPKGQPGSRRSPKEWAPAEQPEDSSGLPGIAAMPDPAKYAKVRTDKKYKDGDYGEYKVVNGEVYKKK